MNVGEIRSDQGRLEEAEPLLRRALRVRQAAGDQVGVAMASSHLGRLAARKGAYEEARVLLYRAQTGFREAGAEGEAREVDARVAECLLLEGRAVEALADIESSLRQDASRNAPGIQTATLHRLAGYAYIQIGDYDTARMHLEDSYQAAKERRSEYEMALARRAQARLADFLDEALPEAWAECKAILDRLGIVQVCEPPLIHSITPVGVNVRLPADEDELVAG
jgi:tetratricopeptide (TPR) repeat protein